MAITVSVVVPVFNEEGNILPLFTALQELSRAEQFELEAIFVKDGSTDSSPRLLRELALREKNCKPIFLSRNFGQQAAYSAGLELATGDAVVLMDADFQDPPEVVREFLKKWREGCKIVYGIRRERKESWLYKVACQLYYRVLRATGDVDIPTDAGDFCLLDRQVANALVDQFPERRRFLRGLRAYCGFATVGLPYNRPIRATGSSKYTFSRLASLAMDGLVDFSLLPLRFTLLTGILVTLFTIIGGTGWLIYLLFSESDGRGQSQWGIAAILAMLFLVGVIITALGIIGEYLGRIYREVKRRPTYIVAEKLNF